MKKILLMVSLLVGARVITVGQTAEDIVNNYLEYTGGAENWKKIQGTKMSAKINLYGVKIPIEIIKLKSGESRSKIDFMGKEFVLEAFDGKESWAVNTNTMQAEKSDKETTENIKREMEDFPNAFIDYKVKGYKIELLGKEKIEGSECFKIKLTKKPQVIDGKEEENIVFYFFDAKNYLPVMYESEIRSGSDKGVFSQTRMSNYKEVDGFLFAFTITQKLKGASKGKTIQVTEIEINPEVDEAIFKFVQ